MNEKGEEEERGKRKKTSEHYSREIFLHREKRREHCGCMGYKKIEREGGWGVRTVP